jgi:hypothetical protein
VTNSPGPERGEAIPDVVIAIVPEPTGDERDALLAALAILIAEPVAAISATQTQPLPSRWAHAGREAAFEARRIRRGWQGPS